MAQPLECEYVIAAMTLRADRRMIRCRKPPGEKIEDGLARCLASGEMKMQQRENAHLFSIGTKCAGKWKRIG